MKTSYTKLILFLLVFCYAGITKGQQTINSLSFDGINDYVSIGNNSTIKPTSALTVEAWVKLSSWSTGTNTIISCLDTAGYRLQVVNGFIRGTISRHFQLITVSYNGSALSGWHHIALVYNGQVTRLYVDGVSRATNDAGAVYTIGYNPSANTNIGYDQNILGGYCSGAIDEVRVWSIARGISTTTMNTEVLASAAGLLVNYRFNQGTSGADNSSITTLKDLTSNAINGSLLNFTLNGGSSNWVEGYPLKPINQSAAVTFSNRNLTSFTINWTRPGSDKGGNNVKVFLLQGTTGNVVPVDGTDYPADTAFGNVATKVGATNWYCVYNGTGSSVNVGNLVNSTTYRAHIIEYQKSTGLTLRYYTAAVTGNPANGTTDFVAPTTQSSNINITALNGSSFTANWTRGNGSGSIVFVKQTSSDVPLPVNNTTYSANANFKSGTQIGLTGWYCVYKGIGTSVSIGALSPGKPYQVVVFEYNGIAGLEKYLSSITTNSINQVPDFYSPSTQANNDFFTNVNGSTLTANCTKGNGTYRIAFLKQSNDATLPLPINNTTYTASATFKSGTQIDTSKWYCVYKGNGSAFGISGLTAGIPYKLMVLEYNGTAGYEKYLKDTITGNPKSFTTDFIVPLTQASNLTFSAINGTSFTANWTRGSGSSRIVFVKQAASGASAPVNNTTYNANARFMSGTQIGTSGWYCVYKNTGTSVTITGLTVGLPYQVMVCDYNGTAGFEKYNIDSISGNLGNQVPDYNAPVTQASNITFSLLASTSFTASWTRGNGSACAVFVTQTDTGFAQPTNNTTYTANRIFKSGTQIGSTGWYCVYKGTGTSVNITSLLAGKVYRVMVIEYNGATGFEKYLTSSATNNPANQTPDFVAPTSQALNIVYSSISNTSFRATWTNGNGSGRLVFITSDTSEIVPPVANNVTYTGNAAYHNAGGSIVGNWYCAYKGTGTTVLITGLTLGQHYKTMVLEYNGSAGVEKYLTSSNTNNPSVIRTAYSAPTNQAYNITITPLTSTSFTSTWHRGSGLGCVVFLKQSNSGTAIPENDSTYTANTVFGSGKQIGSTGWYCIYKGAGSTVTVTGLTTGLPYQIMVCEYNGTVGYETYLTSIATNNPYNTILDYSPPTVQASDIVLSYISSTSIKANWTRGNGTACAVFVSSDTLTNAIPDSGITYSGATASPFGTQIGSSTWHCIYNGTGATATVTGLTLGQHYKFMVCEYDGTIGRQEYNVNTAVGNPAIGRANYIAPTTQASIVAFSAISYTGFTTSWLRGNGSSCAVFVKEDSVGTAIPNNDTTYTASTIFKNGKQIGSSGWYCVYKGVGTSVAVSGLLPGRKYRVKACEYNGTAGFEKYLTTDAISNPNNQLTNDYSIPSSQASNIIFTIVSQTSFTASWTNGNGSRRVVFVKQDVSGVPSPVHNTTYSANAAFMSGSQIGASGWYAVYDGTGTSVLITGLTFGLPYQVMVIEYNGTANAQKYLTTTAIGNPSNKMADFPAPTTSASNIVYSNIGSSSFSIDWTRGNGSSCAVFIKQASSGTAAPANNTSYTANSIYASGSQIGATGWYCIYNGTGTNVNVTGLNSMTTYITMVCEYNGTVGLEKYRLTAGTNNPKTQLTDADPPTVQSSQISFTTLSYPSSSNSLDISWIRGNGLACAVFVKENSSSGTISPSNNIHYTANTVFGTGTQIGSTGWYCVYNGSGTNVTTTGLLPNTHYNIQVFEYFGNSGSEKYNITTATNNPNSSLTDFIPPTAQTSGLTASNISSGGLTLNWVRGNGSAVNVFVAPGGTAVAIPGIDTTYNANSVYGSGTQIRSSGWYSVYNGTGTTVNITGLSGASSYKVVAFEYNGTVGKEKYYGNTSSQNLIDVSTYSVTTWNGTSWSNGAPSSSTDAIIAGTFSQSVNVICNMLTINSGISMNIQPGYNLTVYNSLVNHGILTIKSPTSSMTASGSVITYGNIVNTDAMVAERYITKGTLALNNYNWHYMSSPVGTFNVENTFASDIVSQLIETGDSLHYLKKGESIVPGSGYMVKRIADSVRINGIMRNNRVKIFTGTYNTGNISIPLTRTATSINYIGYNLVGNPYPSSIDWDAPSGWTKTNIYNYTYIWNGSVYVSYDGDSHTGTGSRYIPPMQGFYVLVSSGTGGTLAMTNEVRTNSTTSFLKSGQVSKNLVRISSIGNSYSDQLLIYNAEGENAGFKLFSPIAEVPQIYIQDGITELSLLKLKDYSETKEVQLGFKCEKSGSYQLRFDELDLASLGYVYLFDSKTNEYVNLSEGQVYSFDYSVNDSNLRFKLIIGNSASISAISKTSVIGDKVWAFNKKVFADFVREGKNTIEVFNIQGIKVYSNIYYVKGSVNFDLNKSGVYLVRITNANNITNNKILIR